MIPARSAGAATHPDARTTMNIHRLAVAGLAAAALLAGPGAALAAKTLVYCSEGSPEGFQPQFFTTGTTFDAVSVPMFNRLVEFEIGTTNIIPALAEIVDRRRPTARAYTFKLRNGVKFHSNANFKPTRDFNADDVLFSWNRMADDNHPFHKMTAGPDLRVLRRHGHEEHRRQGREGRRYTVRFVAEAARGAVPRRHGDGLRVDPLDRVLRHDDEEGHARTRPTSIRSAPARSSSSRTRRTRRSATRRSTSTGAAGRRSTTWSTRSPRDATARYAKLKTGECQVMAFPKPADLAEMKKDPQLNVRPEGRPQRRLHRVQRREEAVRQQAGAPGAQHGDQQGGDPRRRLPGRRAQVAKNPIPPILWSYNDAVTGLPVRPGEGEGSCSRRPAIRTASKSISGTCR